MTTQPNVRAAQGHYFSARRRLTVDQRSALTDIYYHCLLSLCAAGEASAQKRRGRTARSNGATNRRDETAT